MADENRPRLGRGLAALLGDAAVSSAAQESVARGARRVPIEYLKPNSRNPRRSFDDDQMESLAASIREKGVIQPIIVRSVANAANSYEIIAGERRWRAAQRAGLHDVPIIVVEANDRETLELAIIENVQRADLNAIDEALGYEQLINHFQYTQADLARVIGKSRSHVTNTLRLLNLPEGARKLVVEGVLSAGHARALLSLPDPETVARRAVAEGLSVRDLEKLSRDGEAPKPMKSEGTKVPKDPNTQSLERELTDELGLSVTVDPKGDGGRVTITYKTLEQFDLILSRLRN
jgi:ParB family chromosome partitioning protein